MTGKRTRRDGGFTIAQLLVTLLLAVAVLHSGTAVMLQCLETGKNIRKAEHASLRARRCLGQLRRDIWSAVQVQVPGPSQLRLRQPTGRIVTWKSEPKMMRRLVKEPDEGEATPQGGFPLDASLQFRAALDGNAVRVTLGRQQATLVSQQRQGNAWHTQPVKTQEAE
jgi:type II secretory pathway component PulJ